MEWLSRILKVVWLSLIFAWPLTVSGQSQSFDPCLAGNIAKKDGPCWNSLSTSDKIGVIRGFWIGKAARKIADSLIHDTPLYWIYRDWLEIPDSTTLGDLVNYFDRLYKIPANRKIDWHWAYILAAMNFRDDDSDDRLSLIRFLRHHKRLPTEGKFIGVKAPDVVTVRAGDNVFDIQLAGVSSQQMTAKQIKRAMGFLRGLTHAAWSKCSDASQTVVQLRFEQEMFRGRNQLSAKVQFSERLICLGDREVKVTELLGASAKVFRINYFMVSRGLAYKDDAIDPKWPEDLIRFRKILYSEAKAKRESLYLYGPKAIPLVDEIIRYGIKLATPASPARKPRGDETSSTAPTQAGSASGLFVTRQIVVTNNHVVSGCSTISGTTFDRQSGHGTLLAADQQNDLALIRFGHEIRAPSVATFRAGRSIRAGKRITIAGFPLAGLLASGVTVTTGVVSNLAGPNNDVRLLQISAPVQPGNSGGPVLDQNGVVVGMVVAKLDALMVARAIGDIPQNVNFAIKGSVVKAFLDAHNVRYQTRSVGSGSAPDVSALAQATTVFLQCNR